MDTMGEQSEPKAPMPKQQPPPSCTVEISESSLLANCPVDLLVEIARDHMTQQDRCQLSRVCRDLHKFLDRQLYIDDANEDYKALWHACETDDFTLCKRTMTYLGFKGGKWDSLANRPFQKDHSAPARLQLPNRSCKDLTPLVIAIRAGSHRVARLLLNKGADPIQPDLKPIPGRIHCRLPVNWAAQLTNTHQPYVVRRMMGLLLRHGADLHARPAHPKDEKTGSREGPPLLQATSLQHLVSRKEGPTTAEMYNDDLQRVFNSRRALLVLLLDYPPTAEDARARMMRLVCKLLQDFAKWEPLFYFNIEHAKGEEKADQRELVFKHVLGLLEVLLGQPDVVRGLQNNGEPLYWACLLDPMYQDNVASLLMAKDCLVTAHPLYAMCFNRGSSTTLFEKLLNHEATTIKDVNAQNDDGATMLHVICSSPADKWRLNMAQLLIDRGASVTIRDHEEKVACDKAKACRSTELVQLLYGAYNKQTVSQKGRLKPIGPPSRKSISAPNKHEDFGELAETPPRSALNFKDKNKSLEPRQHPQCKKPKKKQQAGQHTSPTAEKELVTEQLACEWLIEAW